MILITRLHDKIEKNYMHTERMYSELANQQSIQKQEINDITLKKLTKKHIGARICWLRNKLGRK